MGEREKEKRERGGENDVPTSPHQLLATLLSAALGPAHEPQGADLDIETL